MRPWTTGEVRRLKEAWGRWSTKRIAAELGRSVDAVTHKASRVGLEPRRRSWSPEDDAELLRLRADGMTVRGIALSMGTTEYAVAGRLRRIA